jgi:hypothetical protein
MSVPGLALWSCWIFPDGTACGQNFHERLELARTRHLSLTLAPRIGEFHETIGPNSWRKFPGRTIFLFPH